MDLIEKEQSTLKVGCFFFTNYIAGQSALL